MLYETDAAAQKPMGSPFSSYLFATPCGFSPQGCSPHGCSVAAASPDIISCSRLSHVCVYPTPRQRIKGKTKREPGYLSLSPSRKLYSKPGHVVEHAAYLQENQPRKGNNFIRTHCHFVYCPVQKWCSLSSEEEENGCWGVQVEGERRTYEQMIPIKPGRWTIEVAEVPGGPSRAIQPKEGFSEKAASGLNLRDRRREQRL